VMVLAALSESRESRAVGWAGYVEYMGLTMNVNFCV
jgi:hypothetical protein